MGKSQKPLHITVDGDMLEWPEVQKLIEQGHIVLAQPHDQEDIIFGKVCWRMDESLRKYLPIAIQAARKAKYGKEKRTIYDAQEPTS